MSRLMMSEPLLLTLRQSPATHGNFDYFSIYFEPRRLPGKVPTQIGDDAGVVTCNETDINNDGFSMRSELVASIPASSKHHAA